MANAGIFDETFDKIGVFWLTKNDIFGSKIILETINFAFLLHNMHNPYTL